MFRERREGEKGEKGGHNNLSTFLLWFLLWGPGWGGHYSTAFRMVSTAAMRVRTSVKLVSMAARLVAICD